MSILCIHCHFHQPPRENPYLGLIPIEQSAQPFENWNERIFRESYLPNLYAHYRKEGRILKIVNNYEYVSFNFTFSLVSWLLKEKPWFTQRLKGKGKNAIATGFNHTILPLDPEEDREVQIVWGIRAFEKVFERKPFGFWLPELAVDRKTLSLLVKHGIRYVLLAPHQVQAKGSYLRHYLPEGHIDIFVYDGELSHDIAFGELINQADRLIRRVEGRKGLTLIAVDGETFGHHKKFGEMGLAYLVENYPNMKTLEEVFRNMHPEGETDIREFTSWSCAHGVERWRSDCGCTTGGLPGWHQKWRGPMREALEIVRSRVKERLFGVLEKYTKDPQSALFDFVDILLGGSKEEYLQDKAKRHLSKEERVELFKHLYAYKYISYAFSSDGWFFAEISGIEAVNNLLFAKRAIDLIGDREVEEQFLKVLSKAPSNLQIYGNGLGVWQSLVLPQGVSKERLITSITALELSDVIPQEGTLGNFYYKVEGFEPWKVYLKDMETEEEFEVPEELREFNLSHVPQPFLSWLLDKWASTYLEEDVSFTESYELLLEDLLFHARGKYFEAGNLIEDNVKAYLRLKLYILLRRLAPVNDIKKVLEKAESLNLDIKDASVRFWMERYISKKILMDLSEREAKEIATFVKDYNREVGKYELMVSIWELQNWAWENREKLSPETISLLEFA